jgi:hypothetical protein
MSSRRGNGCRPLKGWRLSTLLHESLMVAARARAALLAFQIANMKKPNRFRLGLVTDLYGRDGVIRTLDPLHPMQVRYRAALRPD